MLGKLTAAGLLAAAAISAQPAAGDSTGVRIGAIIGASAGRLIAEQGEQRSFGYYWFRDGCYFSNPNGTWMRVQDSRCH